LSDEIIGEAVDVVVVDVVEDVGVVSVVAGVESVELGVVSVDVEPLSLVAVVVESAAVDVLSVEELPASKCMPIAPEAITPAQSKRPNARTIPARRSVLRPFISPAPLLPQIRRIV
jgi:hypothetical protein